MTLLEAILGVGLVSVISYLFGSMILVQKKYDLRVDKVAQLAAILQDQVIESKTSPLSALPTPPNNCEIRHYDENQNLDTANGFPKRRTSTSSECDIEFYHSPGYYTFLRIQAITTSDSDTINASFSTPFLKLPSVTGQLWQLDFEGNFIKSANQSGMVYPVKLTTYRK